MKKIYTLGLLLALLGCCMVGCVEDKGNYDYGTLNDLTIGNIKKEYIVEQFTRLQITPEITAKEKFEPGNYEYAWILYDLGIGNRADTLSQEMNLDVEVANTPTQYGLFFGVKDKQTGVEYQWQNTFVTVINSYSQGLLTLSRVGEEANITFLNIANSLIEDAYQKVNGKIAGKNPTGIRYVSSGLSSADPMVVIMTDDETGGIVADEMDLSYVMDFKDMFYFPPAVIKPQAIGTHEITAYEYLINDGDLYTRQVMGAAPYPKFEVRIKGDYKVEPFDFFDPVGGGVALFYDYKNERFMGMKAPIQGDALVALPQDTSSVFDPSDMKMQMVWGKILGRYYYQRNNGRAVMQDHDGGLYMISFTPTVVKDVPSMKPLRIVPLTTDGAVEAHCFTAPHSANFLYYAYDNKIACVSFQTGNLMNVYEFEEGKVDYIECDQLSNVNQMWVGVSDGSATKKSGSIFIMEMSTDGSLKEVEHHLNVCGKVVDFEYKKKLTMY